MGLLPTWGKYVLLDFWVTWCGPCVAELPHLKSTFEQFGKDDRFVLLSLSLDDAAEAPRKFVAKNEIKWPQAFLGEWSKTSIPDNYGVSGIPALFLVGPDGKILAKDFRGESIPATVAGALKSKPAGEAKPE